MSKANSILGSFDSSVEVKEPFFTFSNKTIRFNHGNEVYPVANLTKIGMYKVKENKMPLFLTIVLALVAVGFVFSGEGTLMLPGIIAGVVAGFGLYQRIKPGKFAFGIKTASGEERYIYTTNQKFISKVVTTLSDSLENSEEGEKYEINIKNASIEKVVAANMTDQSVKNEGVIGGSVNTGRWK